MIGVLYHRFSEEQALRRYYRVSMGTLNEREPWITEYRQNGVVHDRLPSWEAFSAWAQYMADLQGRWVFRGQANEDWKLEPRLARYFREFGIVDLEEQRRLSDQHLERFKEATLGRRGPNPIRTLTNEEWWALGQHYGLDTPLLDWTRSPFVAAFFAFQEETQAQNRTVWAMRQDAVSFQGGSNAFVDLTDPVSFIRPATDENSRLLSQNGVFSSGPNSGGIEHWVERHFVNSTISTLFKVIIPNVGSSDFLRLLNRMNINHSSLFPDLEGASKFCNMALRVHVY
jgi:hypothetical protein